MLNLLPENWVEIEDIKEIKKQSLLYNHLNSMEQSEYILKIKSKMRTFLGKWMFVELEMRQPILFRLGKVELIKTRPIPRPIPRFSAFFQYRSRFFHSRSRNRYRDSRSISRRETILTQRNKILNIVRVFVDNRFFASIVLINSNMNFSEYILDSIS